MWSRQVREAAAASGYQAFGTDGEERWQRQNPVLIRGDVTVRGSETRQMCEAVGTSPARSAVAVRFERDGLRWAVINTHMNSHVQASRTEPRHLPRKGQYREHAIRLTEWVEELRGQGYRVIVAGDLNWAWSPQPLQWWWSPKAVFGRLGMVSQFEYGLLPRPKGDRRAIEYVLFHPDDATCTSQRFITPEASDHPWHAVTLQPLTEEPA